MAVQSQVKLISTAIVAFAIIAVFYSWAKGGFGINTATYQGYPNLATAVEKYGCYSNGNMSIVISSDGMSIPGSHVKFSKSVLAEDKHGQLIYFEPAINVVRDKNGQWTVFRDDKDQMISKIYFIDPKLGGGIKIPWITDDGIILNKSSHC